MASSNELRLAVAFFVDLTRGHKLPLHVGSLLREEMLAELKRKRTPKGYRYTWLNQSANRLVATMRKLGEAFNEAHPGDRCSTKDLIDVLRLAADRLEGK